MSELKLPFFSRGEISPRMAGRVDTAAYQSGLKTAQNAIVDVMGGIMNRPGTVFITTTKYFDEDKPVALIPFAFNSTDTHLLEFGDRYLRIIREDFPQLALSPQIISNVQYAVDGSITLVGIDAPEGTEIYVEGVVGPTQINDRVYVVSDRSGVSVKIKDRFTREYVDGTGWPAYVSGGTADKIYEIETPYLAEDVGQLSYAQSADILFIVHTDYPPMELRRRGLADWELVETAFNPTTAFPGDVTAAAGTPGTTTVEYQVTAIDADGKESLPGLGVGAYSVSAVSLTNPVSITLTTTHVLQEFDEVYIDNISGTTELNGRRFNVTNITADGFDLRGVDGTDYTAYVSGGDATPTFVRITDGNATPDATITWTAVADAVRYSVYKAENGIFGFIGETTGLTFVDDNIDADTSDQPPQLTALFQSANNYPGAIGFYQQRMVLGGSLSNPDTWYASQPGDYKNFIKSSPTKDDDAITMTLTSGQINQIRHFITMDSLGVFTSGQEWTVNSGGEVAFSPFTVKQSTSTNWGISEHRPFMVGGTVVFIQEDNRTVRSFAYDQVYNTTKSNNLSLLSSHLFDTYRVNDWALARTPYSAMIMTRSDGGAACMVYNEEQSVIGWTRWDTQGYFENVGVTRICLEPNTQEPDDGIYFSVRRPTGNGWVRFIERLHNRRFDDVRDAFFVDCGLSYDDPKCITDITVHPTTKALIVTCPGHGFQENEPVDFTGIEWATIGDEYGNLTQPNQLNDTKFMVVNPTTDSFSIKTMDLAETVITSDYFSTYYPYVKGGHARLNVSQVDGMDHLEGMYVSVLADGYPLRGQLVTNGVVSLPGLASRVHCGLSYRTDIETLPIEPQMGSSSIQGRMKRINKMWVRVNNSREFLIGYDNTNLNPLKRVPYVTGFTGLAPTLFTGDREVTMPPTWDGKGVVFVRQLDPLPVTILSIYPEFSVT